MRYIKINDDKYPAEFQMLVTQKGNTAIRVTSEAPQAEGFLIVDEEDNVISDMTDFVYLYREDETCKEYTKIEEAQIPTESFFVGIPESAIERQIRALNNRITDITPYEQTKKAYYGEVEKVFYGVPNGNLSVFYDGEYTVERIEDRVIIKFPTRLTDTATITISVQ